MKNFGKKIKRGKININDKTIKWGQSTKVNINLISTDDGLEGQT